MGLPGPKPQPFAPVVRHERLRKSREGSALPSEEARGAGLGRSRQARERRDDALAVELQDPLLLAAHEVDVELTDADCAERLQLLDVLVDLPGDTEAANRFVVDERGVRRAGFRVMLVVVARAIPHVRGQIRGETLLAVTLHEIDDVVRHERREPADAVADLVAGPNVGRRRHHDGYGARVAAGFPRSVAKQSDAPPDETRVGELDDRAVGDAARELERLRSIPRDPHREVLLSGPVEPELRSLVRNLAALAEIADDLRRLLEHREVRRLLAKDAPRGVTPADAEIHPTAGELLQHRENARGDRRLARRGVGDACPEPQPLGVLRHPGEQYVGLFPEDMAVEEPPVLETG